MTKKYNTPMLQMVGIKRNDIITGSDPKFSQNAWETGNAILGADRFRDDFDAGY